MFAILKFTLLLSCIVWCVTADDEAPNPTEVQMTSSNGAPAEVETTVPAQTQEAPASEAPPETGTGEGEAPDEATTEATPSKPPATKESFPKGGISRRVLDPRDYALIYENLVPPEFRSTDKRWPGHIDIFQQYIRMPPEEKKKHHLHWKILV